MALGAGLFHAFLDGNGLRSRLAAPPEAAEDDRAVAAAFQRGEIHPAAVGDLFDLAREATAPLAVRSSSVLEDAQAHPFAGVYVTKMIPNHALDPAARFKRLLEAVKLVWASACFAAARAHRRAFRRPDEDEGMGVIVQEVVGRRSGTRYYPDVSAVARSFNFYPSGPARPEEGVVDLALGLGKTIVDGGKAWTYSPAHPFAPPPFSGVDEMLDRSQREFWAVFMGTPPYDPLAEAECLSRGTLAEAEEDGALALAGSTYDPASDRVVRGLAARGPRLLDFRTLLSSDEIPFNEGVRRLLDACVRETGSDVEVELALAAPRGGGPARLGFVQLRPLAGLETSAPVSEDDLGDPRVVVASRRVMGNGIVEGLRDVVFVDPVGFEASRTRQAAEEIGRLSRALGEEGRPFALLGFGRWGSSDPWLGIPVDWADISGARVLVEATLPGLDVEPSQGAHFFHNLMAARVLYLCVPHRGPGRIDWDWLRAAAPAAPGALVRHLRLTSPLAARVDARAGRGVLLRP